MIFWEKVTLVIYDVFKWCTMETVLGPKVAIKLSGPAAKPQKNNQQQVEFF